jgi:hypothetical protein
MATAFIASAPGWASLRPAWFFAALVSLPMNIRCNLQNGISGGLWICRRHDSIVCMVAIFSFPDDARWNEAEQAIEFSVAVGEFEGSVFVPRRVFQSLIGSRPTPEECVQHYHLNRAGLERIAEAKIRERQLDDDANIRISGRDLRHLRAGLETS